MNCLDEIGCKNWVQKIVTNQPPFHSFVLVVELEVVLKNGGAFHHHVMFVLNAEQSAMSLSFICQLVST